MISLNKECFDIKIEVRHGTITTGKPVLCSGAVVALKVELDVDAKIAAVSNLIKPSVILYSGDIEDINNYTRVLFSDYEGFEVFACEVYNKQLNVCLIKNV